MIIRCALYAGTVAPENRERLSDYILNVHLPMIARWPRIRKVRLLRGNGEPDPFLGEQHRYFQCFEFTFDNREDMDFCLNSPERHATRKMAIEDFPKFKALFDGEVHHVNYWEVIDIPVPG